MDLLSQFASRGDDLLPRAVIKRYGKLVRIVMRASCFCIFNELDNVWGKIIPSPDNPYADAFANELSQVLANVKPQKPHKIVDFFFRAAPIFFRKTIEREVFDPKITGRAHRAPNRLNTLFVTCFARKPPRRSPAAIPVHNDSDVPGAGIHRHTRRKII